MERYIIPKREALLRNVFPWSYYQYRASGVWTTLKPRTTSFGVKAR